MPGRKRKHLFRLFWSCGTTRGKADLAPQEWSEGNDYWVEVNGEWVDCTEWIHERDEVMPISVSKINGFYPRQGKLTSTSQDALL